MQIRLAQKAKPSRIVQLVALRKLMTFLRVCSKISRVCTSVDSRTNQWMLASLFRILGSKTMRWMFETLLKRWSSSRSHPWRDKGKLSPSKCMTNSLKMITHPHQARTIIAFMRILIWMLIRLDPRVKQSRTAPSEVPVRPITFQVPQCKTTKCQVNIQRQAMTWTLVPPI